MVFLRSTVLGEGAGIDFWSPGGLPVMDFGRFGVILCVASVIRFFLVFFQRRPKFAQIPDQSLFCRGCLALVAGPFSCRGSGRA